MVNLYLSLELKELVGQTEFTLVHSGWLEGQEMVRSILDEGWGKHTRQNLEKLLEQMA
jgi:hypothetical protein